MILFLAFLFLAIYNTGCMTALQLQHYGIYPAVGKEGFAEYMRANNRAAASTGCVRLLGEAVVRVSPLATAS